jgi:hypothetical protein
MHAVNQNPGIIDTSLYIPYNNRPTTNSALSFTQDPLKEVSDFANLQNKISNSIQMSGYQNSLEWQVNSLKQQLAFSENRLNELLSNNWIIPNYEIQGLSGYVCRRCNSISITKIQNIGYDMTMQAKHTCDEEKVKSIKMVSIRPSDVWHFNDYAAGFMLESLNSFMPGQKYLVAKDYSTVFKNYEKLHEPEDVKLLLGIPRRFYLYSLDKDERIDWIDRAVGNLGIRTNVEDFEIRDFLRRVKSTYAIFEIPADKILRRILIKIAA